MYFTCTKTVEVVSYNYILKVLDTDDIAHFNNSTGTSVAHANFGVY